MTIDVVVDRDRCMGSCNCVYRAPAVFDLDDENLAVVAGDAAAHKPQVRLAVEDCPTGAISLTTA